MKEDLPVLTFKNVSLLRKWLESNHTTSDGIWVRLYKKYSGIESVSFLDVLDEGLCFGWSESMRIRGDEVSYLQKFTPRRKKGTASERNKTHTAYLIREGRMTASGLSALHGPLSSQKIK